MPNLLSRVTTFTRDLVATPKAAVATAVPAARLHLAAPYLPGHRQGWPKLPRLGSTNSNVPPGLRR